MGKQKPSVDRLIFEHYKRKVERVAYVPALEKDHRSQNNRGTVLQVLPSGRSENRRLWTIAEVACAAILVLASVTTRNIGNAGVEEIRKAFERNEVTIEIDRGLQQFGSLLQLCFERE